MAEPQTHTMEEIAATLLTPTPAESAPTEASEEVMALAPETAEPEVEASTEELPSGEIEDVPQIGDEEITAEEVTDLHADGEVVDEAEEEAKLETSATEEEPAYLDITDEDLLEVSIDGKVEYRSVEEAKKALAGEGAIQKRLQEATETRNSINSERDEMRLKLEDQRSELVNAISQLSGHLFQPTVAPPDETLRQNNPAAYLAQSDAYINEQQALATKQTQLQAYMNDQARQQTENMKVYRDQQEVLLHQKIPELANPQDAPKVAQTIIDTAKHYGFHEKEVGLAYDHRLFLMAMDAGKYRALMNKQGITTPSDVVEKATKAARTAPRKLRSGVAARRVASKQQAKLKAKTRSKAQETGNTADITDFILSKR